MHIKNSGFEKLSSYCEQVMHEIKQTTSRDVYMSFDDFSEYVLPISKLFPGSMLVDRCDAAGKFLGYVNGNLTDEQKEVCRQLRGEHGATIMAAMKARKEHGRS